MLHRPTIAALALSAYLGLTACAVPESTTASDPAPAAQEYQPAPVIPEPATNAEDDAYLSVVRDQIPQFNNVDDDLLINAAQKACDALDVGVPATDLMQMAMDTLDLDGYDAGFFIGAGIGVYCPENLGELA